MAAVLGLASAYAGGHGEAIQFSDPNGTISSSNLDTSMSAALERMNPAPSNFKQAQDDLFRPLSISMPPQDSMGGVLSVPLPQTQSVPVDKRTRDAMDRRRNWAFTDLSDLYPQSSAEEMMGVKEYDPDGKNSKDTSVVEKYYNNLGRKSDQKNVQNTVVFTEIGNGSYSTTSSLNPVISAYSSSDPFSKESAGSEHDADILNKNFDPSRSAEISPEGIQAALDAQKRSDDFKRLLDPNLPAFKPVHVAGSGMEQSDFARQLLSKNNDDLFKTLAKPATEPYRSILNPQLGMIDPTAAALHSHVLDDPTAAMLGMPNPLKPTPIPKPPETVRQMLDPFGASVMKPKF